MARVLGALVVASLGDAFYLPGVAPRTFRYGDKARARRRRRRNAARGRARSPVACDRAKEPSARLNDS